MTQSPSPATADAVQPRPRRPHRPRDRRRQRHRPGHRAAAGPRRARTCGAGTSPRTPCEEVAGLTGGTAEVVDLSDLDALDRLDLDADVVVNCAGIQHVAPVHEFPTEKFSLILRIMLEAPFRHHPRRPARHVRAGLGPGRQRLLRARPARLGVQERLRHRQARPRGALEGGRAGGRRARRHLQLRQPRLRPHPAGRQADRRPGRGPRHLRGARSSTRCCSPPPRSSGWSSRRRSPTRSRSCAARPPRR